MPELIARTQIEDEYLAAIRAAGCDELGHVQDDSAPGKCTKCRQPVAFFIADDDYLELESTVLPQLRPGPSFQTRRGWSEHHVEVAVARAAKLPLKGGMGLYEPRTVLLCWRSLNGRDWSFEKAVITGPPDYARNVLSHQTVYLNDPGYPQSEPGWLQHLVDVHAP